jgi:hypothetical protein
MAKNPSTYVSTTVPFKPSPVVGIKPVKPLVWKTPPLPKPPKPDPTTLVRMVKIHSAPAIVKAQTAAKR